MTDWLQAVQIALAVVGVVYLAAGIYLGVLWWRMPRHTEPAGEVVAACCVCARPLTAGEVTEVEKRHDDSDLEGLEPGAGTAVVGAYCPDHVPG